MTETTFYWHDYETFGANPAVDRPAQFAGLRTDQSFNPIGEPLVIYCKPGNDALPEPEACLLTGITPQLALEKGTNEAGFIQKIHHELAAPGTCGVGYNSLRFDDEVTRYTLYRNFFDPYAREWQHGNSRWDIIDMLRLCYALRPEGIEWPYRDDGNPSFRLEDISEANGISHTHAHDALSDVHATIALAKLIKTQQPRLFDYCFELRKKHEVLKFISAHNHEPIIHTSSKFPAEYGCTTLVTPVAPHPVNKNGIIVYDLRYPPDELLSISPAEIRQRLFTKTEQLPDGQDRIHLKTIHINKCPALAPKNTLTAKATERLQLDMPAIDKHLLQLKQAEGLEDKIQTVFKESFFDPIDDPEQNLYGGFFSDGDRSKIEAIRNTAPEKLGTLNMIFEDKRLPELFFRYRARNWPETLSPTELSHWEELRTERLHNPNAGITPAEFEAKLETLGGEPGLGEQKMTILEDLAEYGALINSKIDQELVSSD